METKKIQIIGGFPQSDWNQNDKTTTDYIKNRPFYDDGTTVVQIDEKFIPNTIARTSNVPTTTHTIFTQSEEPVDAKDGDIWIDTSEEAQTSYAAAEEVRF